MKANVVLPLLLFGLAGSGSIVMAQSPGTFTSTGNMTTPRGQHTATLLFDGRVLIAGGVAGIQLDALASAELYDPSTGTFTPTGNMRAARLAHSATLLPDGKVLITGGYGGFTGSFSELRVSAEIYDPANGTFTPTGAMTKARFWHTSTLLKNGNVLVTGGFRDAANSAELYEVSTGRFIPTSDMTAPRFQHKATLLPDGRVLIVPGGDDDSSTAEIYDPESGSFRSADWKAAWSVAATLNPLPNGKVLISLEAAECDSSHRDAVVYDPSDNAAQAIVDLPVWNCKPSGTLLSDGRVLVAGGWAAASQIYDSAAGTFSRTADVITGRVYHRATLLNDGTVLLAGGYGWCCNAAPLATAELYRPSSVAPAPLLFTFSGNPQRQGAILHAGTNRVVSTSDPAVSGEVVEIYGSGLLGGGVIPPQMAVGGKAAEVLWFGKAPGFEGLNQMNVRVPNGVARSGCPGALNLPRPPEQ